MVFYGSYTFYSSRHGYLTAFHRDRSFGGKGMEYEFLILQCRIVVYKPWDKDLR